MIAKKQAGKLQLTLARLWTIGWRLICMGLTRARYPLIGHKPSLLLKYETAEQRAAYETLRNPAPIEQMSKTKLLVVIPFRDKWTLTAQCLARIFKQDLGALDVLIALVDNGSVDVATRQGVEELLAGPRVGNININIRHLRDDRPFNFSRLNNLAVHACADFSPDYVAFINNDIVLEEPRSLERLVAHLIANPSAASVGCTLLYPDRRIQHLCIAVGVKVVGAHPFKGARYHAEDPWYQRPRPVGAATAALLVVRCSDFAAVGGFDEALANCYQDVDLALKFRAAGQVNWVLPAVVAIHHETATRRPVHHWDEVEIMYQRWGATLTHNSFYSSAFSRWSEQPALSLGEGAYPWQWLSPPRS